MFRGVLERFWTCSEVFLRVFREFWGCFRGGLGSFEGVLEVVWRCIGVLIGV